MECMNLPPSWTYPLNWAVRTAKNYLCGIYIIEPSYNDLDSLLDNKNCCFIPRVDCVYTASSAV